MAASWNGEGMPPQSIDAEEAILGSVLLDRDAISRVAPFLRAADFFRERNGLVYAVMLYLFERDEPIDYVTLSAELERRRLMAKIGGIVFLSSLLTAVPTPVHIERYGQLVARSAFMRRLISAGGKIAQLGFSEAASPDEAMAAAEAMLGAVPGGTAETTFRPVADILASYLDEMKARAEGNASGAGRISTGFPSLDTLLGGGWETGDLIVLAARPSIGKTNLALAFALAAAAAGEGVAVFSLEMSESSLVGRMLSITSQVEAVRLRDPARLTATDMELLAPAISKVAEAPIEIDDASSISVQALRARLQRLKRERDIGLVIVDHIQLLRLDQEGGRRDNRVQELTEISRQLKAVARDMGVPVVAVGQLSRAVEQRPKKIPNLSDLRESGSIEQDADVVILLYRDDYYNAQSLRANMLDVIVAKHRNGPVGTVTLGVQPSTLSYVELPPVPEMEGEDGDDPMLMML